MKKTKQVTELLAIHLQQYQQQLKETETQITESEAMIKFYTDSKVNLEKQRKTIIEQIENVKHIQSMQT